MKDPSAANKFLTTGKEIGVSHYYEKKRKNILPI